MEKCPFCESQVSDTDTDCNNCGSVLRAGSDRQRQFEIRSLNRGPNKSRWKTGTIFSLFSWGCFVVNAVFAGYLFFISINDPKATIGVLLVGGIYGLYIAPTVSGIGIICGLISVVARSIVGFSALIANCWVLVLVKQLR